MILSIFYSILSIVFLSKKSPRLMKILNQNTKKINEKKNNDPVYQMLTIFMGYLGIHNIYEKKHYLGLIKLVIISNYLVSELYFMQKYKKENQDNFDEFLNKKNIDDPEKKIINKNLIEYTVKDKDSEYKYLLTSNIYNYIKQNHKNFIYYKYITDLLFFVNILYWFVDILKII